MMCLGVDCLFYSSHLRFVGASLINALTASMSFGKVLSQYLGKYPTLSPFRDSSYISVSRPHCILYVSCPPFSIFLTLCFSSDFSLLTPVSVVTNLLLNPSTELFLILAIVCFSSKISICSIFIVSNSLKFLATYIYIFFFEHRKRSCSKSCDYLETPWVFISLVCVMCFSDSFNSRYLVFSYIWIFLIVTV